MTPTYLIATVNDFLKVPEARIEDCLAEFLDCIKTFRGTTEIIRLTAAEKGFVLPDGFAAMPEFTWIDDGLRNQTVHFIENKGE